MNRIISGIQQVGVGVSNAEEAFTWYKKYFGFDIVVFKDAATASLMQQYTGHQQQQRLAILAMNLQGGGGIEFWQNTSRTAKPPVQQIEVGDTGIFCIKIKCKQVEIFFQQLQKSGLQLLSNPSKNLCGNWHFYLKDPYNNLVEVVEDTYWFALNNQFQTGGITGLLVGVSNMQRAFKFYQGLLGYDIILSDSTGVFKDWENMPGGSQTCRRVLLSSSRSIQGAFGKLLGPSTIELVQVMNKQPVKIHENRYWGDLGFIHLCHDITGMDAHDKACSQHGFPLTVNSKNSFDMGDAAGHFSYNEDADGTLMEYVETHKVPIAQKLGLYLNLQKRDPTKCLPNWVVKCLRFNRVK